MMAITVILGRVVATQLRPEETRVTNDRIVLGELLGKGSDVTFLREMIAFAA